VRRRQATRTSRPHSKKWRVAGCSLPSKWSGWNVRTRPKRAKTNRRNLCRAHVLPEEEPMAGRNLRGTFNGHPNANGLHGRNSAAITESARAFKGIICDVISEFESFSIGAGWCQALSDCSVDLVWDVPRRVLASLRDRHLGPPMMGSGGCGGPIYGDVLAVRLTAGIRTRNGLASSIVPAGTSLHRSAEFAFSPVVFLLCTTR
jgi:hypothetical protein